jgi:hypothetical protein
MDTGFTSLNLDMKRTYCTVQDLLSDFYNSFDKLGVLRRWNWTYG